ncbi:MAG: hypothetical protein PHQ91_15145, partial [Thermoanaerobaculaceae bacterium]|nr:hypothetical protein [Thermoanaerobaculaceae bacterium]
MSAWLAVLPVVLLGWVLNRLAARGGGPGTIAGVVVWGALAQVTWMTALDLAGIRWSPPLLFVPAVAVAVAAALAARRGPRHT